MATKNLATGVIVSSQIVVGFLGNFLILFHFFTTTYILRWMHVKVYRSDSQAPDLVNSLFILSKGIPHTVEVSD